VLSRGQGQVGVKRFWVFLCIQGLTRRTMTEWHFLDGGIHYHRGAGYSPSGLIHSDDSQIDRSSSSAAARQVSRRGRFHLLARRQGAVAQDDLRIVFRGPRGALQSRHSAHHALAALPASVLDGDRHQGLPVQHRSDRIRQLDRLVPPESFAVPRASTLIFILRKIRRAASGSWCATARR
jgi:hypothetical protein